MTEEQPHRITAEHVRQAEEVLKQTYAQPYIERSQNRMRAVFMASMLWAIFIGWIFGMYIGHVFPFGIMAVALGFTVHAVRVVRRNRD